MPDKTKRPVLSKSTDRWEMWLTVAYGISMAVCVVSILIALAKGGTYGA